MRQRLLLTIILNIFSYVRIDKYKKIKRYCIFNEVFKIIEITKNRVILKHFVDKKNYDDDRKGRRVGRRKPLGFFAKVICLLYVPFPFTHHELLPKNWFFFIEIWPTSRKKIFYNFCIGNFTWIKLYLLHYLLLLFIKFY